MSSMARLSEVRSLGSGRVPAALSATGTGWPQPARPVPEVPVVPGVRAAAAETGEQPAMPPSSPGERDRSGTWLRNAAAGLVALAAAAAAVSFSAQYEMVDRVRRLAVIAGLEAAIPDTAALVFACLGVAVALQGHRAVRSRLLNLAAVGTSVLMNAIAAAPGWRSAAIWVMPPVAYALASDTLIGVVRAWVVARHHPPGGPAGEEGTPLSLLGGLARWLLRLAVAPISTLGGFRAWVLTECPVAPGTRATLAAMPASRPDTAAAKDAAAPPARRSRRQAAAMAGRPRARTKTARFLDLAVREHGSLAQIPLTSVGRISTVLAPRAGLHPGAGRAALRTAILAAHRDAEPGGSAS